MRHWYLSLCMGGVWSAGWIQNTSVQLTWWCGCISLCMGGVWSAGWIQNTSVQLTWWCGCISSHTVFTVCVCGLPAADQCLASCTRARQWRRLSSVWGRPNLVGAASTSFLSPADRNTPVFRIMVSLGERRIMDKAQKYSDIKECCSLCCSLNITGLVKIMLTLMDYFK